MKTPDSEQITALLTELHLGNEEASSRLMPLIYGRLRRIAGSRFKSEKRRHTLQPTELVHELYLRMVKPGSGPWTNREHFFAIAARAVRQILVEHARARRAQKRGGLLEEVDFEKALTYAPEKPEEVLALDGALAELERLEPRQGRVVELRFFGGLSIEETASVLGVSPGTVKADWNLAKAWLRRELKD
jgi:RNA polymerase sigma factor (TIGR02999 family)